MRVVNSLLQVDDEKYHEVQSTNTTSRIIRALERQISHILTDGGNFTEIMSSLAVKALNIPPVSVVGGLGFAAYTQEENGDDSFTDVRIVVYNSDAEINKDLVEASIELPEEALRKFLIGNTWLICILI